MINSHFFIKLPINFKGKCKVYPPTVNNMLSDERFFDYKKILTLSQEEIEDEYFKDPNTTSKNITVPTPLEFLLQSSYYDRNFEQLAKDAFKLFIGEEVSFMYDRKAILIGDLEKKIQEIKSFDELVFIEENEFFDFQNLIRECCGEKAIEPPNPNEDPRVKRIKAKARYRDKIKAKKGMGISLGTTLASICCMGIGITPLNIGDVSYVAIKSLMETYQEKEAYELDIKRLLAGADPKKIKLKHWIRNLE